ncbi:MAG: TPM domain-containing protein [bacterium]
MNGSRIVCLLASGLLLVSLCQATESDDLLKSLQPRGMVSDFAGVLKPDEREAVEATLRGYQQRTGHEIGVAVVESLKGGNIDDFANKLFAQWGVGKKGQDNGVLLLVAIKDRSARIEVGYGMEPKITDAIAGRILSEQLFPAFKQGRFGEGLSLAVAKIMSVAQGEAQSPSAPAAGAESRRGEALDKRGGLNVFFWVMTCIFVAITFLLGGGIGGKQVGLIFQGGAFLLFFLIFTSGFGFQTGAIKHGTLPYLLLASTLALIAGYVIGRRFPQFMERIENAMARSGSRSSRGGSGWSSGGGGSGGGFSGGSSGGGGASGKW